ncbi:MAG: hypothetical protein RBU30_06525 [Polyangia bacterium]|jgi:hypothetical protein|nr:hypothetical protein [Polyangia bacterium]
MGALLLLGAPVALAQGGGATVDTQSFHPKERWVSQAVPDPRAELLIKVNVVRIYSAARAPDAIAPPRWISTQLEVANRLFRLPEDQMRSYGPSRLAPVIQMQLNRIIDVPEDTATRLLGIKVDTENVLAGDARSLNGETLANTWDLRSLKVTGETHIMTIYCVWDAKASSGPTSVFSFGGESNVGFTEKMTQGSKEVLTVVTGVRARMGVVVTRQETAWMNAFAHELGHYFGLHHAWERSPNQKMGISDLGSGPQGQVDDRKEFANVMDYDNGDGVRQYFTRQQLQKMYEFARDRASTQIQVERRRPGQAKPAPAPATPSPAQSAGKVEVLRVESPAPGGPVTLRVKYEIKGMLSQQGLVVAWFNDAQGQKLMDADGTYRTTAGHIAVGHVFKPKNRAAAETSRVLELPPGQLHLGPGKHNLSVDVSLIEAGREVAQAQRVSFEYSVPLPQAKETRDETPRAWIKKAVVTPKEIVSQTPYVSISTELILDHLKGAEVVLELRFAFSNGRALKDFDQAFASSDGLVMFSSKIVPLYPRTQMKNLRLRIPHSQLHLAKGIRASLIASLTLKHRGQTLASDLTPEFVLDTGAAAKTPLRAAANRIAPKAAIEQVALKVRTGGDGQGGVIVGGRLRVAGYRGKKLQWLVYVTDYQNRPVQGVDAPFRSKDGQLGSAITLSPRYDSALFPEAKVFIPFGQLRLPPGRHRLLFHSVLASGGRRVTLPSPPAELNLQLGAGKTP